MKVHGGSFWVMSCCVFLCWWLHGCEQLSELRAVDWVNLLLSILYLTLKMKTKQNKKILSPAKEVRMIMLCTGT